MLKNKSVVKMISIVLAIVIWAYVIGEVNPTVHKTISQIPVELTNTEMLADSGLTLSSEQEYYTDIVVEGSRSDVNTLKVSEIHAAADVYGYDKGENQVDIDVTLPSGISLEEIKTPTVTVKLEELASVFLPVTAVFTGEAENNLEGSVLSMAPAEVEVKGAASIVSTVKLVRVQIDVSELSEQSDVYSAEPTAWNKAGKLVQNVSFSSGKIDVEAVLYHTKQVPLEMKVTGSPDKKYGDADITVPKEITVRGTADSLSRITSITAESVDVSDVTKNTTLKISPNLPQGVELANKSKNIGVKIEFK